MLTKSLSAKIKISKNGMYSVEVSDENGKMTAYKEISSDKKVIQRFVDAINRGDVSPLHINEMIEDIIG